MFIGSGWGSRGSGGNALIGVSICVAVGIGGLGRRFKELRWVLLGSGVECRSLLVIPVIGVGIRRWV